MATALPANVNLVQLLAASPGAAIVGTEPIESVQSGTSVAFTFNQVLAFAQSNFSVGNLAAITGLSVLGVTGTASAVPAAIAGTTDQVLRVAQSGTTFGFGAINLATTAAVTGVLATANGGIGTSTLGQIPGSSTNDAASAGKVGEFTSVTAGSVNLTTTVQRTLATLSLSPGDWRVEGVVGFHTGTAAFTSISGGVTVTSGTLPSVGNFGVFQVGQNLNTAANDIIFPTGAVRISFNATSNVYLVAGAGFTTAALAAYGALEAWRVR